jgi:hypothetical protein
MYSIKQFEELRDEFLIKEALLTCTKEKEYTAGDQDRLINLREIAALEGRSTAQVAMTLLLNQLQRINMAVKTSEYDWSWRTSDGREGLKQKIADGRVYLHLLAACFDEEVAAEKGGMHTDREK